MKYRRLVKRPWLMRKKAFSRSRKNDISESRNSPIDHIMFLQRTIGNRAVQRMLQGSGVRDQGIGIGDLGSGGQIQAKLRIGQPNDMYEQEADRVADVVMRMPENTGVRGQLSGIRKEAESAQRRHT